MIWLVIAAIAAAAGAGAAVYYWNKLAMLVADWLTRHNLNKSALNWAFVQFDKLAVGLRRKVMVHTHHYGTQIVDEARISIEEIDDPKIRAQLREHNQVNVDIMHQI